MAKVLNIFGMVVAGLTGVIFTLDLAIGLPFGGASMMLDISFILCAAILGYLSWATLREKA